MLRSIVRFAAFQSAGGMSPTGRQRYDCSDRFQAEHGQEPTATVVRFPVPLAPMKTDLYTADAICKSMGLPSFELDPACTGAAEGIRLLLKPSFHPEICLTFADDHVSVVCAREMIWRQVEPSPMFTYRSEAALPAGAFETLLTSLVPMSRSDSKAVPGITIDGMPTELLHFRSGALVLKVGGNGGRKGDFSAFVALAIDTAWQCSSNSHCRNSLAEAAEYVGSILPREADLPRKPVVQTMVLGPDEDRAQVLEALRRHHDRLA